MKEVRNTNPERGWILALLNGTHYLRPQILLRAGVLLIAFFGPLSASAGSLDENTWDICANASSIDVTLNDAFINIGWIPVSNDTRTTFSKLFAHGFLATSSGGPDDKIDWLEASREANKIGEKISISPLVGSNGLIYVDAQNATSVLSVFARTDIGPNAIHCIYAGPAGNEIKSSIESLAQMDEMTGAVHPNQHIRKWVSRFSSKHENDPTKTVSVEVLYGQYQPGSTFFGQPVRVEIGFSLLRNIID